MIYPHKREEQNEMRSEGESQSIGSLSIHILKINSVTSERRRERE